METLKEVGKGFVAWFLVVWGSVTLNELVLILAAIYSFLQITAFFYPWHKKLWKYFGATE